MPNKNAFPVENKSKCNINLQFCAQVFIPYLCLYFLPFRGPAGYSVFVFSLITINIIEASIFTYCFNFPIIAVHT